MAVKKPASNTGAMPLILAKLNESCLDLQDCKALMMGEADPLELEAAGHPKKKALEIPYFDRDGKPTGFKRWRYLEETREGFELKTDAKPMRYVQASATISEVYMPPFIDWRELQSDTTKPLVITEGELKAAYCTRHVMPCLGLGGVYSWRSAKKKLPLLPVFYDFKWAGRHVIVAFDSDAATNHMVLAARAALCKELLALGALPHISTLEAAENGAKRGLDDTGFQEGHDAVAAVLSAAAAFATSASLHELNAEVAYIKDPGMVVVVESGLAMRPHDFTAHAYSNRHYYEEQFDKDGNCKLVKKKAAPAWLEWPSRYELARMAYSPGEEKVTTDMEYNTWPGWGCTPKRGDVSHWKKLLDYMFHGKPSERKWFEQWCAYPLQNPGAKMYTAVVIWGVNTGTGKSLTGVSLGRIYGKNFATIGDKELQDPRNEWAQQKQFVLGDDVTGHDQRKFADRLKAMITQEKMRIDPKYIPSYYVIDRLNYYFSSNHPDAFFLEDDDRRFFIHELAAKPLERQFYLDYLAWLNGPGASALFYHLLRVDLGTMSASDRAPDTDAKRAMVADGLSDLGSWVRRLRDDPHVVLRVGDAQLLGDLWSSQDLIKLYDPENRGRATAGGLGKELKRAGVHQVKAGHPLKTSAGQARLFAVRNTEKWLTAEATECIRHYNATRANPTGARPKHAA